MLYFVARYVTDHRDRKRRRYFLTEEGDWTADREVATTFVARKHAKDAAKVHPGSFVEGIKEPRGVGGG